MMSRSQSASNAVTEPARAIKKNADQEGGPVGVKEAKRRGSNSAPNPA